MPTSTLAHAAPTSGPGDVAQDPQKTPASVQAANDRAADRVVSALANSDEEKEKHQKEVEKAARAILKDATNIEARLSELERTRGPQFAQEVRAHLQGWGVDVKGKTASYVTEGGSVVLADKQGAHYHTRFGDEDRLSVEGLVRGQTPLTEPYKRLENDKSGPGLSAFYAHEDEGGSWRAGGIVRGSDNFDLDASRRINGEGSDYQTFGLGYRRHEGESAVRAMYEQRSGPTTLGGRAYYGDESNYGAEVSGEHRFREGGTLQGHLGVRREEGETETYGALGYADLHNRLSLEGAYKSEADYHAALRGTYFNDAWSLGGSLSELNSEEKGREQAIRIDAATYVGDQLLLRGFAGLTDSALLDEPAYRAAHAGGGVTLLTHKDRLALTLGGVIDTEGNWEAGLGVELFKSRLRDLGQITESKRKTIFTLFVGYKGGIATDNMSAHLGHDEDYGIQQDGLVASIGINF